MRPVRRKKKLHIPSTKLQRNLKFQTSNERG